MEFVIILGLFAVVMLLMTRSQRKQQKKAVAFRDSIEVGSLVMTASGCVGTVGSIEGDLVTLLAEDGSSTRWIRAAIAKEYVEPMTADQMVDAPAVEDDATGFAVPDDVSALIEKPSTDEENKS